MKKILITFGVSIATFSALYFFKPIVIKYLSGNAIILKKVENYSVMIDNKLYKDVLFKNENNFILYLKNENIDYSIITINLKNNIVGFNCASKDCIDTFLGNQFQSDMGKMYTLFDNTIKGPNFDSKLKVSEQIIDFYIPNNRNNEIHIQLNHNDSCQ